MKVFYTAKSFSGETKSGELEVKNERDLANQLRADGFMLTSFKEFKNEETDKISVKLMDRFWGISLKDKLMFTRNLGVMVSSGLPLSRAISNISAQTRNKRFAEILDNIFKDIQAGATFADSLAKYPAIFNDLFVNMVRVGETGGNLEEVLDILALQLEKEHELMSKIKGAMMYPSVILVVMIGIAIIMLTYILPKLLSVFKDMDVELPAATKFVIALSDAFKDHSILIAVVFVFLGIFLKIFVATKAGKKTVSFVLLKNPLTKNMVVKINCARFCRIYSSLLKSGVSVVEALKIVSNTLTNHFYKIVLRDSIEQVQKGVNLSKVIGQNPSIFPVLVTQMLEVGEETGKTESMLLKLAEFYEDEVDQLTKNMSSIIEPVLMIVIGAAVGFFAVSMLQPIYGVMENIK
ncbi:MAG TPA: type II secretion system F family protein [Candidatus Moranbacteria bacterium]|nr:type II secretion system F family protein [Candidatus Moranbacteria bacterium]